MNKKGALELSVNAIVILIIALAVLGLIIGFAVNKFNEVSSQVQIQQETPEPTPRNPIQLPGGRQELTLSKNTETLMDIKVYNPYNDIASPSGSSSGTFSTTCNSIRGSYPDNTGFSQRENERNAYCSSLGCQDASTSISANYQCDPISGGGSVSVTCAQISVNNVEGASSDSQKTNYCEGLGSNQCTWATGDGDYCKDASAAGASNALQLFSCSPALTDVTTLGVGTDVPAGQTVSIPLRIDVGSSQAPGRFACKMAFSTSTNDEIGKSIFLTIE